MMTMLGLLSRWGRAVARSWWARGTLGALMVVPSYAAVTTPPSPTPVVTSVGLVATDTTLTPLDWPVSGSAALYIPQLGVEQSNNDEERPIASLTKMMTAYEALRRLPLLPGQSGPCFTVSKAQEVSYANDVAQGLSTIEIAQGEQLCESQLVQGIFVHSGADFARMLALMAWPSLPIFIRHMNLDAQKLGLNSTHYADVVGIDANSQSTALDQAHLAAVLMQNPVVARDADMNTVTLPLAGTLGSYSPLLNQFGIVGVKTGVTDAAGGCYVMARLVSYHGQRVLEFSVVLGQGGANVLITAANVALALSESALVNYTYVHLRAGTTVGSVIWNGGRTALVLDENLSYPVRWVPYGQPSTPYATRLTLRPIRLGLYPGAPVGSLRVALPTGPVSIPVTVTTPLVAPTA